MFKVQLINPQRFSKNTRKAHNLLINRRDFNQDMLIEADKAIQQQFESEGNRFKTPWRSLKIDTIRRRRQHSDRILQDTGMLRLRWKHEVTADGGKVLEGDKRGITVGGRTISASYYGDIHDKGKGNVPKRQIIPKASDLSDEMKRLLNFYVKDIKRKTGM